MIVSLMDAVEQHERALAVMRENTARWRRTGVILRARDIALPKVPREMRVVVERRQRKAK